MSNAVQRCSWVSNDPLYQSYHDNEWGRPELESQPLFEKLCLDGQQAGLSWITILKKQSAYRAAFHQFNPQRVAAMTEEELLTCMENKGIVRNKLKIHSIVKNAKAYLDIEKTASFSDFIWQFTKGKTIINEWASPQQIPTSTDESKAMSKALKKRGFTFVGETICYAFMQAVGMVNDHQTNCHCYEEVCKQARR